MQNEIELESAVDSESKEIPGGTMAFLGLNNPTKNDWQLTKLLALNNIHTRYRRSFLGITWSLINPIMYSLVLWFVFVRVFKDQLNDGTQYAPFVLSGVLVSSFFSIGLTQVSESLSLNVGILRKIAVNPRIFLHATSLSNAVNFSLGLIPLMLINVLVGGEFSHFFLAVIPLTLLLSGFIFGLGLIFAVLFARFDDMKNILTILLQIAFYATPIFYPLEILSGKVKILVQMNPLTEFLTIFRAIFLNIGNVGLEDWLFVTSATVLSIFIGLIYFRRNWPEVQVML